VIEPLKRSSASNILGYRATSVTSCLLPGRV